MAISYRARNTCSESLRLERLRRMFVPFEPKHKQLALVPSDVDQKVAEFKTAVENMPRSQKELILLLLDNDLSYEELAAITGSTVSAVKSRLFRARESLRQSMTAG
jgi:RNA polymerase sigma-70 factor (ECF subfamily)